MTSAATQRAAPAPGMLRRVEPNAELMDWARTSLRMRVTHAHRVVFPRGSTGTNSYDAHRLFAIPVDSVADGGRVDDLATGDEVPLPRGTLTLLPADRRYRFRFAPGLRVAAWHVRLETPAGHDLLAGRVLRRQVACDAGELAAVWDAFDLASAARWLATEGWLRLWLARLVELPWDAIAQAYAVQRRWQPVLQRMERGASGEVPVRELARLAGISAGTFARRFRADFGVSPRAYRAQRVAARIVDCLLGEATPLAQLAARFGFSDAFALSHFVRRATGASPTAWRRRRGPDAPAPGGA